MALTTSIITGRVPLPSDEPLQFAELTFALSGLDTQGAEVLPGGVVQRVALINSELPPGFKLWQNTAGLRGTHYQVLARWTVKDRDGVRDQYSDLGIIQIGTAPSYTLASLLNNSVPMAVDTFWSAISYAEYNQVIAAASSINTQSVADLTALAALDTSQWKAAIVRSNATTYVWDGAAWVPPATPTIGANLTALDAMNATPGIVVQTGAATFTKRTLTGTANQITVVDGDGVAGNPTFALAVSNDADFSVDPDKPTTRAAIKTLVDAAAGATNATTLGLTTGAVSDAVALANAVAINAHLASADGAVFNWRSDDISIGETIRLGRDGNAVIGVSTGTVFGLPTSGAIARWRGDVGGTMFWAHNADNSADIDSPVAYGITCDARKIAGVGFRFTSCMKPMADALHVWDIREHTDSYAYAFDGKAGSGVGCIYGGKFGSLTAHVYGVANGFVFSGPVSTSGKNVCFNQFDYCHVTCVNGFSFVFQKGDDNVFTQIGVSRGASGTGGQVLFNTLIANQHFWVGNIIHNMNLSKTDGAPLVIEVANAGTMGNIIGYNGVDYAPTLTLSGTAKHDHNKFRFLGQTNYAGGWTERPRENLFPFLNVVSTDQTVLDWYQEVTGVPTVTIGGSSAGITYSEREITTTRIGNSVRSRVSFTLTSKGGLTGDVEVGGLPFTVAAGQMTSGLSIGYYAGLASLTSPPVGGASPGTTKLALYKTGAVSGVPLGGADITNTFRLNFVVDYRAAE